MSIYNYGIGGNEVKVDANESIADIPSNRTLLVQKLTNEAPVNPEAVYNLQNTEDVFEHFRPTLQLEHIAEDGSEIKESMVFKNLGDFDAKMIKENSDFLSKIDIEKEQSYKIARQLSSNRALLKALSNPETREAIIEALESSIEEIKQADNL